MCCNIYFYLCCLCNKNNFVKFFEYKMYTLNLPIKDVLYINDKYIDIYKMLITRKKKTTIKKRIIYFFYYLSFILTLLLSLAKDTSNFSKILISLFYICNITTPILDFIIKYYDFSKQELICEQIIIRLETEGYNFIYLQSIRYIKLTHIEAIPIFILKIQRIVQFAVVKIQKVQKKRICIGQSTRFVKTSMITKYLPKKIINKLI